MFRFSIVMGSVAISVTALAAPCPYEGNVPAYVNCIAGQASDALDEALAIGEQLDTATEIRRSVDGGPIVSEPISPPYHLTVTVASAGSTVPVPDDIMVELCGDRDGCEFRLGLTRWVDWDYRTAAASDGGRLYYDPLNGHWRTDRSVQGTDGDGVIEHPLNAGNRDGDTWDTCYFTDGTYSGFVGLSDGPGFSLLMWNGYDGAERTCELTLID